MSAGVEMDNEALEWKWINVVSGIVIVVMGILVGEQYRERAVREKRYWQELKMSVPGDTAEFLAN